MARQYKEPVVEINPEPVRMIHVLVGDKFKEDLRIKCIKAGTTLSDVTRELLEKWLNEPSTKKKRRVIKTKRAL